MLACSQLIFSTPWLPLRDLTSTFGVAKPDSCAVLGIELVIFISIEILLPCRCGIDDRCLIVSNLLLLKKGLV